MLLLPKSVMKLLLPWGQVGNGLWGWRRLRVYQRWWMIRSSANIDWQVKRTGCRCIAELQVNRCQMNWEFPLHWPTGFCLHGYDAGWSLPKSGYCTCWLTKLTLVNVACQLQAWHAGEDDSIIRIDETWLGVYKPELKWQSSKGAFQDYQCQKVQAVWEANWRWWPS